MRTVTYAPAAGKGLVTDSNGTTLHSGYEFASEGIRRGCDTRRLRRSAGTPALRAPGHPASGRHRSSQPDVVRLGRRAAAVHSHDQAAEVPQCLSTSTGGNVDRG